jgi:hypothetical protein
MGRRGIDVAVGKDTSVLGGRAELGGQMLWVTTGFRDIGELCKGFADRVENGSLILYGSGHYGEGASVSFGIQLADGSVAVEGFGKVIGCVDCGAERPLETRFDVVVEVHNLRGRHGAEFEAMLRGQGSPADASAVSQDGGPLLVCRRTYGLRVFLTLVLAPATFGLVLLALDGFPIAWLLALLSAGLLVLAWVSEGKARVRVFRRELEVQSLFGIKTVRLDHATQYQQSIQRVRVNGLPAGAHYKIVVQRGGLRVRLGHVRHVEELMGVLVRLEMADVLPYVMTRYEQGDPVAFGPFVMQGDRIRYKRKEIPLADLTVPRLENGRLKLKVRGKMLSWATVEGSSIPNLHSMLGLIESVALPG